MKVKDWFTDESKWCKHANWLDAAGNLLYHSLDGEVCQCCLAGAIILCYPHSEVESVCDKVRKHLNMSITEWNDDEKRKFEDVKNVVEELGL